ncbi:Glutamine-rich protein 2 [Apostichopus japonicus]|uniref:Glutamine-rich protein 2 n=1 Tax=Stichopus japonicus TaxID=307972 RepID=A0A2G8KAX1_STIJA|nr:Glutamine-rich protein 2 [Apostichopus japonicus]
MPNDKGRPCFFFNYCQISDLIYGVSNNIADIEGHNRKLVFEATVGTGINSDIAIDDVYYMATCVYPTPRPKFNCLSELPAEEVAATQVCDWSVDCSNGRDEAMCMPNSFDDDLGRYTVIDYVLYPWTNSNVTDGQGPTLDWSGDTTSGAYMLVDTVNPNLAGRPIAVLVSPEIQQVYGSSCQISFWYYMSGDAGRLILAFSASDDPYEQTIVTRIYGDQGSFWQEAIVNLNRIAKPFVHGSVWCGMVQYGVAWFSMVWHGSVWCGMVQYDVAWCSMMWHGSVWCGMMQYGVAWFSMVWHGSVWCGMVQYDVTWFSMVWKDSIWCSIVPYGVAWFSMVWQGSVWCGMIQYGVA